MTLSAEENGMCRDTWPEHNTGDRHTGQEEDKCSPPRLQHGETLLIAHVIVHS